MGSTTAKALRYGPYVTRGPHSFTRHPHTYLPYSPAARHHRLLAGTHCAYPRRDGHFLLLQPSPWPDDLHIPTWSAFPRDIPDNQIWTSYVKAFKSYRPIRQTDTTEIISRHFVGGQQSTKLWLTIQQRDALLEMTSHWPLSWLQAPSLKHNAYYVRNEISHKLAFRIFFFT